MSLKQDAIEAAHELKSSWKQLSEGNKPGKYKLESLAKISDKAKCYRLKQVIICYRTTISRASNNWKVEPKVNLGKFRDKAP